MEQVTLPSTFFFFPTRLSAEVWSLRDLIWILPCEPQVVAWGCGELREVTWSLRKVGGGILKERMPKLGSLSLKDWND